MRNVQFNEEILRKEKLLCLLEKLEDEERKPLTTKKQFKFGRYDRLFNGIAKVVKVGNASLRLSRENGKDLGSMLVTAEIANLVKVDDQFLLLMGLRHDQWHLISLQVIGSYIQGDDGKRCAHLSGAHPTKGFPNSLNLTDISPPLHQN